MAVIHFREFIRDDQTSPASLMITISITLLFIFVALLASIIVCTCCAKKRQKDDGDGDGVKEKNKEVTKLSQTESIQKDDKAKSIAVDEKTPGIDAGKSLLKEPAPASVSHVSKSVFDLKGTSTMTENIDDVEGVIPPTLQPRPTSLVKDSSASVADTTADTIDEMRGRQDFAATVMTTERKTQVNEGPFGPPKSVKLASQSFIGKASGSARDPRYELVGGVTQTSRGEKTQDMDAYRQTPTQYLGPRKMPAQKSQHMLLPESGRQLPTPILTSTQSPTHFVVGQVKYRSPSRASARPVVDAKEKQGRISATTLSEPKLVVSRLL